MIVLKIATVFLLVHAVRANKKIELQDIENDNLKSEKEKEFDKSDSAPQPNGSDPVNDFLSREYLRNGFLKYHNVATPTPSQRFVHQYAVTEQPERSVPEVNAHQAPVRQHLMGYLSSFPLQIYLVPYTINEVHEHLTSPPTNPFHQSAPPGTNEFLAQYLPSANVGYTPVPTHTVAPYQTPLIQYTQTAINPAQIELKKPNYDMPSFIDLNSDNNNDVVTQSSRATTTEGIYHTTSPGAETPRHYYSSTPIRPSYRPVEPNVVSEIPHPNPLIFKSTPPHLAHLPKALPLHYRSIAKSRHHERPSGIHSNAFVRRPTSLVDSYIPSSVQVEYLKRGLVTEPGAVYDAIASGRLPHRVPPHFERGFVPNQMYHTGAGGVTYIHPKRATLVNRIPQNYIK